MKTGKIRWYRQLVHHDVWEADISVPPVLFEDTPQGRARHAIAVLRGDSYLFLFDRATGEPLVPIDERPMPQNPQVFTAATQPFPRDAESILPGCDTWKGKLPAGFILGCQYDPPSDAVPNLLTQYASARIAPMSYDPATGYLYAQATNALEWMDPGNETTNGERIPNFPPISVIVA